jgi:hypothetical protein
MKQKIIKTRSLKNGFPYKKMGLERSFITFDVSKIFNLGWSYLDVKEVVPGERIPITWSVFSFNISFNSVIASVFLDAVNVKLFESQSTALKITGHSVDSGYIQAIIEAPDSGGTANDLYKIGAKTLRLDVISKNSSDVLSDFHDLNVIPENVNEGWWQWTNIITTPDPSASLPPPTFLVSKPYSSIINHPFTLIGRMVNLGKSPNNTMTGTVTLLETTYPSGPTVELESRTFTIGPGAHQEIVFIPITRNWGWIIPGIWVENLTEPREKLFSYSVRFSMSDSFGNFYAEKISFISTIHVSVSNEKRGYGSGALGVLGAGIIAAIFTFGAALSVATAVAAGLGKKAQDPPEPDPHYKEKVDIQLIDNIDEKIEDDRFTEFIKVLRLGDQALSIIDNLGIIYNRLLGARQQRDIRAVNLQMESYKQAEELFQKKIRNIIEASLDVVNSMHGKPEFSRKILREKILRWQRQGLSPEVSKNLMSQGCSQEILSQFTNAIQEPSIVEFAQDINQVFTLIGWSFAMIGREVHREALKLFRKHKSQNKSSSKGF